MYYANTVIAESLYAHEAKRQAVELEHRRVAAERGQLPEHAWHRIDRALVRAFRRARRRLRIRHLARVHHDAAVMRTRHL
ncbi:hypothetical protein ARHIZOSPH14_26350 [Agromyces rhizosphaerae]|uniref:Uncharacterized protein n=1 Tax=Agromyces rhizosphaerae TaxID=88374 RepID=A0A9W6CTV8_9MICO|nr:hypothetical protein [Agromyces rhizosphaerae]GLI28393.1 hypothetical protein ARHIZOSPH14_26350 [Agromyces rhizosphaerae]